MLEHHPLPLGIYETKKILKRLDNNLIVELLKLRMSSAKCENVKGINVFNDENLKEISKYSGGIPGFALLFAYILLEDAIKTKRKIPFSSEDIKVILKKERYESYEKIKKKLRELIPEKKDWQKERPEKIVLKNMIYLSGNDITSTEVAKLIGKTKNAVTKTMNKLVEKKLIEKIDKNENNNQSDQRRVPFRINDFVISVFENEHVIPEVEKAINQ
jgi:hypothetical protein